MRRRRHHHQRRRRRRRRQHQGQVEEAAETEAAEGSTFADHSECQEPEGHAEAGLSLNHQDHLRLCLSLRLSLGLRLSLSLRLSYHLRLRAQRHGARAAVAVAGGSPGGVVGRGGPRVVVGMNATRVARGCSMARRDAQEVLDDTICSDPPGGRLAARYLWIHLGVYGRPLRVFPGREMAVRRIGVDKIRICEKSVNYRISVVPARVLKGSIGHKSNIFLV